MPWKCNELMIRLSSATEDEADVFADAEAAMSKLGGELVDASGFQTPGEIIRAAGGTDRYLQRRREAGISTPFPTLTHMTGGFRPGDLIVLAAHTLVLMIHFTRMYDVNVGIDEGEAKLLVKKQRNGPTGWLPLRFHAPSGRFYEQEGRSE